jgi:hypothetical protein
VPVDPTESIARAICSDKWDSETGELSASLFKGSRTSVSRLAITPLEETWELFRRKVSKPPERTLDLIGEINVGVLQVIGRTFANRPTDITVEPDPLEDYPSHAVIPQTISRGLANQIIKNLMLHSPPKWFPRRPA